VLTGVDASRGGHSWLEREFLTRLAAAGMPRPTTQQVLARRGHRVVRVDCWFPDTPVVVELLGYRFHRTNEQMQNDAARANALLLEGLLPFQFTYVDVVEDIATVLSTVAAALAGQVPERRASTGSMRAARMLG
jgi:very-short-patch-repair endonuclease